MLISIKPTSVTSEVYSNLLLQNPFSPRGGFYDKLQPLIVLFLVEMLFFLANFLIRTVSTCTARNYIILQLETQKSHPFSISEHTVPQKQQTALKITLFGVEVVPEGSKPKTYQVTFRLIQESVIDFLFSLYTVYFSSDPHSTYLHRLSIPWRHFVELTDNQIDSKQTSVDAKNDVFSAAKLLCFNLQNLQPLHIVEYNLFGNVGSVLKILQ